MNFPCRRNVYVCKKYPLHHCRTCYPADSVAQKHQQAGNNNRRPLGSLIHIQMPNEFTSGECLGNECVHTVDSNKDSSSNSCLWREDEDKHNNSTREADLVQFQTPPSNHTKSIDKSIIDTPRVLDAPKKLPSDGSISSGRHAGAASAVRSLTPLFNNFAPAIDRANRMGGKFVTLKKRSPSFLTVQKRKHNGDLKHVELHGKGSILGKRCASSRDDSVCDVPKRTATSFSGCPRHFRS